MRTAKNPGKIRFFRSMRTAKNPSKIFSSGPCGQLKTLQKYFRRGRRRRRHRRRRHRCRRRLRRHFRRSFFCFCHFIFARECKFMHTNMLSWPAYKLSGYQAIRLSGNKAGSRQPDNVQNVPSSRSRLSSDSASYFPIAR